MNSSVLTTILRVWELVVELWFHLIFSAAQLSLEQRQLNRNESFV